MSEQQTEGAPGAPVAPAPALNMDQLSDSTPVNETPPSEVKGLGEAFSVFGKAAPAYFAHDMPVIPLDPIAKSTKMLGWNSYHDRMPDKDTQERWLKQHIDGNIGLVLGAQSGVVCIDIDTDDSVLVDKIVAILPHSPWVKIGKKGMTFAYKYCGLPTFRIKAKVGGMIVEHLSSRTQTVIPPSIHPDTRRVYVQTCLLYDVKDQLQILPPDIQDRLRKVIVDHGVDLSPVSANLGNAISLGSRDVTLTTHAGTFALIVMRGDRSLVEAANEFRALIASHTETVAGDGVDVEKHIKNMVTFLRRDVLEKGKLLPKGWDKDLTDEQKKEMGLDFEAEQLEWSSKEHIDYLRSQFEVCPLESQERVDAVNQTLQRLAISKSIPDMEKDRVLQYVISAGGLGLKLATLRKNLRDKQKEEITGINHSQIAQTLIAEYSVASPFRYHENNFWRWGGSHWDKVSKEDIHGKISRDFGDLPAAKKWGDHSGIYNVMTMLAREPLTEARVFGVNFSNGFLTRDMRLHEHDPSHGMTYTLPYRYMPEDSHRCPKWLKHLETTWGRDSDYLEKVEALRDVMCITMFGLGVKMQRAILLYGLSHTGKSQILYVMQHLLHQSTVSTVAPKSWGDKFSPSGMLNKLYNYCGELSDKDTIYGPTFKSMIAGEPIEAQFKNQHPFTMIPTATHWFGSNCIPKSDDDSKAFNRRWIVLTFNNVINMQTKIDDYGQVLIEEEREAICAWVMEAAQRFQKTTIPTFPKSHERFIYEMANLRNSVRMFLMDSGNVLHNQGDLTSLDEKALHDRYWAFCIQGGAGRPVSQKFFRTKAREFEQDLGFKIVIRANPMTGAEEAEYVGLKLNNGIGK